LFLDLTRDFWAENVKNKCKYLKQQQIPFGDDNQKGKSCLGCEAWRVEGGPPDPVAIHRPGQPRFLPGHGEVGDEGLNQRGDGGFVGFDGGFVAEIAEGLAGDGADRG
jgi:hypothetical protein